MIKDMARELFPPDIKPVQRWRLAMFATIMALVGYSAWGFYAFARAEDMKQLKSQVETILILQYEARIRDLTAELCTATGNTKRILENERDTIQKLHKDLTKEYYPILANCEDV